MSDIWPMLLYFKILAFPDRIHEYADELNKLFSSDPNAAVDAGSYWDDAAFRAASDIIVGHIAGSTELVSAARKKWKRSRYELIVEKYRLSEGRLSLCKNAGGELSISGGPGQLSVCDPNGASSI